MRIFLGVVLLSGALAAPIDFNHDDSTGEKLVQYMPTESIIAFLRRNGVPELAIIDFFVNQLHLNSANGRMSRDYFDRVKGWGRKWHIKQLEHWQYDPVEQRIDYGRRTTTPAPPTSTTATTSSKDVNDDSEYTIRIIMKSVGVKDEAVDEFIAEKFHESPFDMIMYSKLIDWGKKWNLSNIDKMAELFYKGEKERQRKEKGLNSETNVVVEDPVQPTTAARTADDSGVQFMFPKQVIEEIIRESSEIFAHTNEFAHRMQSVIQDLEFEKEKFYSIVNAYLVTLSDYEQQILYDIISDVQRKAEKMELGPGTKEAVELTFNELTEIFTHIYDFTRILQSLIVDGELIPEKVAIANAYFNSLSEYEQDVLNRVQFDIQRNFEPKDKDEFMKDANNTY